jgi:hypothetical protein
LHFQRRQDWDTYRGVRRQKIAGVRSGAGVVIAEAFGHVTGFPHGGL